MTTYKKPIEVTPVSMDFSLVLPTGQTIQESSVAKIYDDTGTEVTGDMLDDTSVASPKMIAVVKGGERLRSYKITYIAFTELYCFEEDVTIKIT
jgi:hypothetical protein